MSDQPRASSEEAVQPIEIITELPAPSMDSESLEATPPLSSEAHLPPPDTLFQPFADIPRVLRTGAEAETLPDTPTRDRPLAFPRSPSRLLRSPSAPIARNVERFFDRHQSHRSHRLARTAYSEIIDSDDDDTASEVIVIADGHATTLLPPPPPLPPSLRASSSTSVTPVTALGTSARPAFSPENSQDDFRVIPKRPRLLPKRASPPGADQLFGVDPGGDDDAEDSGESKATECCICCEPLTTAGLHRVVSLRCGHLFGHSCILQWLSTGGPNRASAAQRFCPTCKQPATRHHIHPIYTRRILVTDNAEVEALKCRNRELESTLRKVETEKTRIALAARMLQGEHAELARKFDELQWAHDELARTLSEQPEVAGGAMPRPKPTKFTWQATVTVASNNTACRVLAYDAFDHSILVSVPKAQLAFSSQGASHSPGVASSGRQVGSPFPFGLVRISLDDPSQREYIGMHARALRDAAVCPVDGAHVLTTALDRTVKVVSLRLRAVVQSFPLEAPGWSCAWHPLQPARFVVGLANGAVQLFDIRDPPNTPSLPLGGRHRCRTPVHSLVYACHQPFDGIPLLIVGSSTVVYLIALALPDARDTTTDLAAYADNGPAWYSINSPPGFDCYCARYDQASSTLLLSYRRMQHQALAHHAFRVTITDTAANNAAGAAENIQDQTIDIAPRVSEAKPAESPSPHYTVQCEPLHTIEYSGTQTALVRTAIFTVDPAADVPTCFAAAGDPATAEVKMWGLHPDTLHRSDAVPDRSLSEAKVDVVDVRYCRNHSSPAVLATLSGTQVNLYRVT
ncbi:RING finger and WD repeat domain-containing protein 3 [Tieghemiomyces parasiticus]|uniref:RING-type E3 ubiquitin transferase n=1 Tax=Tieghemiomyces parasiticus TaxID=78921 RepID=A0A9W8A5C8_9FUNG|nr:RING finger and WD repeat domain-containing protein 3 [Tieghemiomyces parasiticus]